MEEEGAEEGDVQVGEEGDLMRWRGQVMKQDADGVTWVATRLGAAWFIEPRVNVGAVLEFGLKETRQGLHAIDVIPVDNNTGDVGGSDSHTNTQGEGS